MSANSPETRPGSAQHQRAHFAALCSQWEDALTRCDLQGAVIYAGHATPFFQDDQGPRFKPNPILVRWLDKGSIAESCCLVVRPGHRPTLLFLQEADYWHATLNPPEGLTEDLELEVFARLSDLTDRCCELLPPKPCHALLGPDTDNVASRWSGYQLNPPALIHTLDFYRAIKTDYEIERMREASRLGARGHLAAAEAFAHGGSEFDIHLAFLAATGMNEHDLPYGNIIAQNEHAGLLHYQHQERSRPKHQNSLLIDAGADYQGYASDITRTYLGGGCYSDEAGALFQTLVEDMQSLQQRIIDQIAPGITYIDLQVTMHQLLAGILSERELILTTPEAIFDSGVTECFCPHGLGHLLGIQVHDVGGQQIDMQGQMQPPPENYATLRLTRPLSENMTLTVEPGLYLIPMLLESEKVRSNPVNWQTIEQLLPFGGIRIEDNVRVLNDGVENLTRDAFRQVGTQSCRQT